MGYLLRAPSGKRDDEMTNALNAYAQRQLEVRAPVRYYEVASLPRNSMGKLMRDEITRLRAEDPDRILQRFPPAPAG